MDVYVFNNITDANPTPIFKLLSLYKGDARISGYNTVVTAEVDLDSSINKGLPNVSLQPDLYREFKWSDQTQTLVQIAFPAFFPDLTRYQAESDQVQVNQGHQPWKLSATQTAQTLVADQRLLKWGNNATATIVSGGGSHDTSAVVDVKASGPGTKTVQVSMARLEGNANGGIWEVISVTSPNMTIATPVASSLLTSPVSVGGNGPTFEGVIGTLTILDHLYNNVGHASVHGASGNGNGNAAFSQSISYNLSFHGGAQEGILALYTYSQADGSIAGAIIVKVLLGV